MFKLKFKCAENFSDEDIPNIHTDFWKNTDNERSFSYDKLQKRKGGEGEEHEVK